jgi:hypothetical protein
LFKRDKLVWDKWDFSLLKWYLDILYNDISVIINWENYDISISNSKLTDVINSDNVIYWIFSSKYVFSEKNHYFNNINLKLYSDEEYKKPYFWWNVISINKDINITSFKEDFSNIMKNILDTQSVFWYVKTNLWVENVNISYNNWNTSYNFNYKNKDVKIMCSNWRVLSLTVSWNNILNNKIINYTDLANYLKLIQ